MGKESFRPAGPGWKKVSFTITIPDQEKILPPEKRFHIRYIKSIGEIEIRKDEETGETTILVEDGFVQTKRFFFEGIKVIGFANRKGITFWVNRYDPSTVSSFSEQSS